MTFSPDRKITDILKEQSFTLSAEVIPPRNGVMLNGILQQIDLLKRAGAQFLAVTKGAGGSLRAGSLPIVQLVKEKYATPCIAHFTCRDLLPEEVENQLLDHHYFGVRNILALRGDPPQGQTEWQAKNGAYEYAYKLIQKIQDLNAGSFFERSDFKVSAQEKTDFCVGAAVYPDHPDTTERLEFFRHKVQAGAEYAITQMIFDADSYERFADSCLANGMSIPILPGTRILKSQKQAQRMATRFGVTLSKESWKNLPEEEDAEGQMRVLETFTRFAEKLKQAGAPGLHLFVMTDTLLATQALEILTPQENQKSEQQVQHL